MPDSKSSPKPILSRHRTRSEWIHIKQGRLSAAAAPSPERLQGLIRMGMTDLVTLQRADEMREFLPDACEKLGVGWHHFPLSGRRLQQKSDRASLTRTPEIVAMLEEGRSVIVHCAAGMHRTGVCMYFVLRFAGFCEEEAMKLIEDARPITAEELNKRTRKQGILREKAEELYHSIFLEKSHL